MARAHDPADLAQETAHLVQHPLAFDRVTVDHRPLLSRQGSRLVDDLVRHAHLADVVQKRGELGVPPLSRRESQLLHDGESQLDHVPAMAARVGVVGLDHVPEQKRCPSVCVAELEFLVDPGAALAREDCEEDEQRQRKQDPGR